MNKWALLIIPIALIGGGVLLYKSGKATKLFELFGIVWPGGIEGMDRDGGETVPKEYPPWIQQGIDAGWLKVGTGGRLRHTAGWQRRWNLSQEGVA